MDISFENEKYCSLKKTYETTIEEGVEAELSLGISEHGTGT